MLLHMNRRTTLVIDASLYSELKARAARERRTLAEVIERTLRSGLLARKAARAPRLKLPSYDLGPFLIDPADRTAGNAELRRGGR
jgi:hypothetical protein